MPDDTLLANTLKVPTYISNYKDNYQRFKEREASYKSNKIRMCSVVLAQCAPLMEAKLQVMEGWEDNMTDLLFILTAAPAVCIDVQQNFSMHVVAHEAFSSLANCFQNSNTALVFKT